MRKWRNTKKHTVNFLCLLSSPSFGFLLWRVHEYAASVNVCVWLELGRRSLLDMYVELEERIDQKISGHVPKWLELAQLALQASKQAAVTSYYYYYYYYYSS